MDNMIFLLETFPHAVAGGLIISTVCSLLGRKSYSEIELGLCAILN